MKAYDNNYSSAIVAGSNGQLYMYSNNSLKLTKEDCSEIHNNLLAPLIQMGYDIDRAHKEVYGSLGLSYEIMR